MTAKTVFQTDNAGHFIGTATADESPMEPGMGVFHIPRGCVELQPPDEWPEDKWPRWNGSQWELVTLPKLPEPELANDNDPVAKLQAFLAANPDVAAVL